MASEPNSSQGLIVLVGKMSLSYLLNKPSSFNGEGYNLWREKMKVFIEGMNCGIWKIVKEGPFVPTHEVNGTVVDKLEKDWSKEDIENVQCDFKAKKIIITLDIYEFLRVSHCETAKKMLDILQNIHKGTTKVKRAMLDTLTHRYELFRIKPEENISQMQTRFTHIMNNMRSLGKTFSNMELVIKNLDA